MESKKNLQEKRELRRKLLHMERRRKMFLRQDFIDLGLTLGQGQPRIMEYLLDHGPVTQKELSDGVFLDVTTMSRTLDRLENSGWLTREKNPGCRRSFLIALTEEGRKKAEQIRQAFDRLDQVIWQGIGDEEIDAFMAAVEKITENLENNS